MLKRFTIVFLLCFTVFVPQRATAFWQAACTPGYENVGPDFATVADAFLTIQSVPGAVVMCLGAGSVTYEGHIDWSIYGDKAIEVRGHGSFVSPYGSAGETIIYVHGADGGFTGFPSTQGNVTISNIRFLYDQNSTQLTYAMILISAGAGYPVILHHNDFYITGTCRQVKVILDAAHGGVVYRNKFTNQPVAGGGCNYATTNINAVQHIISDIPGTSAAAWWASANTMGSADDGTNNLYIESNYFEGYGVAIDMNTSARTVWRFNEMHASAVVDHGYDSSAQGERHSEIYGNTFYCDEMIQQNGAWIYKRGGTGMIFNNTLPTIDTTCGYPNGGHPSVILNQFKLFQAEEINSWPGTYPTSYPVSHQTGWGWINGSNQTVGDSTTQDQPGTNGYPSDGFQQALEPIYIFNNTNNNTNGFLDIGGGAPQNAALAYSNFGKTSGTTLATGQAYVNSGQVAFVAFADLVGGSTPTISDTLSLTWTARQGGTNSGMRLTTWTAPITSTGHLTTTITFDSSSAARAVTMIIMRGQTASSIDKNPAVVTDNTNDYSGPSSGTLAQADEIVLGYYALNGPTTLSGSTLVNDSIDGTGGYARAVYSGTALSGLGIIGTNGSTATTNVTVGVVYKVVSATTSVQPQLHNATADRIGLAGTITFKLSATGSAYNTISDWIAANREYYSQQSSGCQTNSTTPFDGTSGTGCGTRSLRPTTCTAGVGYWSTDQGSWNTSGSGGQGVLDKCTATNTWTNAWYVPFDMPHPLANINPQHLTFTVQPVNVHTGGTLTSFEVTAYDLNNMVATGFTGNVTVSTACGTTLGGTLTVAAVSGVATFNAATATGATASCTLSAAAATYTDAVSSAFSVGPNKLGFTVQPSSSYNSGATVSVTTATQFNDGTTDTSGNNSITLTGNGCTLGGTTSGSASMGLKAFSPTATGIGACSITASATGLTSATSNSFNLTPIATTGTSGTGSYIGYRGLRRGRDRRR